MKKERLELTKRMMIEALIFNGVAEDEVNKEGLEPVDMNNYVDIDKCSITTLAEVVDKWAVNIIKGELGE